jgi:two-component system OmpR family sensor kinase
MLESVRIRLALWFTAAVAAVLLLFAAATYTYLSRSSLRRVDQGLAEAERACRADLRAEAGSAADPEAATAEVMRTFQFGDTRLLLFAGDGRLLGATPPSPENVVPPPDRIARALRGRAPRGAFDVAGPGGPARVFARTVALRGRMLTVVAVQALDDRAEELERARQAFALAIPLALLLAGAGGYGLARRSLAPVVAMSERAARMGAADLHQRLPVPNPRDELGHLATVLNGLLERVGGAMEQQRRFMADAAHELRTPVAIVRGEADVALARGERSPDDYRDALAVVRDQSRRLSRLVDDLFLLARADAGQQPLQPSEIYLNELAADCVRGMRTLATARGVALTCDAGDADLPLRGDEALLHRLVLNLLDNAVKHSPPGSDAHLTVQRDGAWYRLAVRDSGPPIAPELRERLFERFYRGAEARAGASGETAGAGLGLAIARWVATAHGGTLVLGDDRSAGNVFVLRLPAEPPPATG